MYFKILNNHFIVLNGLAIPPKALLISSDFRPLNYKFNFGFFSEYLKSSFIIF